MQYSVDNLLGGLRTRIRGVGDRFFVTALIMLTLIAWSRTIGMSMVGWDDTTYFFEDGRLVPLNLENIWRILTEPFFSNYHPLTTLTIAFDRLVWKSWTPGFHLSQMFFYLGGVLGVYWLFKRLLDNRFAAFGGSCLYAVHAVHVESVAWLASRKDVVCLFFYVLSILCYLNYARRDKEARRWYAFCLAFGIAAMLSKGYAVVLPMVFLCYDLCFQERLRVSVLIDKVPFVMASIAVSVMTVLAQGAGSGLIELNISWIERIAALGQVLLAYIGRALYPIHLSAVYIIDASTLTSWRSVAGILLSVVLAICFVFWRRRWPVQAFGVVLFVLPLGTVMNVFLTLRTWMADRYLLLPTIGSVLAVTGFAVWIHNKITAKHLSTFWVVPALAVVVVSTYGKLTVRRIAVWENPVILWSDTLRKQLSLPGSGPVTARDLEGASIHSVPDSRLAVWLAEAYRQRGQDGEAENLIRWIGSMPDSEQFDDEITLARIEINKGFYDKALDRLRPLAQSNTWLSPMAWGWMGVAYERKGQRDAARQAHLEAMRLYKRQHRSMTPAMLDLAGLAFRTNRFDRAAQWYRKARQADPTDPRASFFLGVSLEKMGRLEQALQLYKQTLELEGKAVSKTSFRFVDVHLQMGLVLEKLGRTREGMQHLKIWLRKAHDDQRRRLVEQQLRELSRRIGDNSG